ncbi:MAG: 30S ribosomal protein S9 [Verrucomicrobia bacterium]|nr:30S ribosomal protein S9 [Verrucomicrobiota bacterium]
MEEAKVLETEAKEFVSVGRRKSAVARVRMKPGAGRIRVNGRDFETYFPVETYRVTALQPLVAANLEGKFDIRVNVAGGGLSGQADAVRHGIARALLQYDPSLRPALKERGLLTRDPREKERKKPGQPGARKRFQYSKR